MVYTTGVGFDELFTDAMEYAPHLPPWEQGGEPAKVFPGGGGVYLLTDAEDRLIQLAAAADLRRALANRLGESDARDRDVEEPPPGSPLVRGGKEAGGAPTPQRHRRVDLREIVRRIRWRPAHSMFEITFEYHRIARALMPDRYLKQVGFGPSWFVHVDPEAQTPRFQAGKVLRSPPGVDLGPFATQADAGRFIEILEDAFDLCRYHNILQQAPAGQACAYFDMGKCPAPCNGSISMDAYRGMIGRALGFACGARQGAFAGWEAAMRAAAGERAYERAAALRQLLERARRIEHEAYRLVRPVQAFRYLVVQRGGGTTRVKPFFVRAGQIEAGAAVRLRELEAATAGWIEAMSAEPPVGADRELQSEHIWLVSHFLFKRETPGLFLPADSLGEPAAVAERVREHFTGGKKEELRDLGGETVEGQPLDTQNRELTPGGGGPTGRV